MIRDLTAKEKEVLVEYCPAKPRIWSLKAGRLVRDSECDELPIMCFLEEGEHELSRENLTSAGRFTGRPFNVFSKRICAANTMKSISTLRVPP